MSFGSSDEILQKKNVYDEMCEVIVEPMIYCTEDVPAIISLLASKEQCTVLRAVGTLYKYVANDESSLDCLLMNGIYQHLINVLDFDDVYILRFTLKILYDLISNEKYLDEFYFHGIAMCLNPIAKVYIKNQDNIIQESSCRLMVRLCKLNVLTITQLFSKELVQKILQVLKTTEDVDVQHNNIELFILLLDSKFAAEELLTIEEFSSQVLLCLFGSEIDFIKETAIDVLVKLTLWRNKDMLIRLTNEKINEAMVKIILTDTEQKYYERAFDIFKTCMAIEDCAVQFMGSCEFKLFLAWMKTCPHYTLESCAEIMMMFTRPKESRQVLYDLSVEEIIISLFRCIDGPTYIFALEAIANLTNNKDSFEKLMTPTLIQSLLITLERPNFSIECKQRVIIALHDFMKRDHKALGIIVKYKGYYNFCKFFEMGENVWTPDIYKLLIDMIEICCNSNYINEVTGIRTCHKLLDLYKAECHIIPVLNILNKLIVLKTVRDYFMELNGPHDLITALYNTKCSVVVTQTLFMIDKLIRHKDFASKFIEEGLLSLLASVKPELSHIKMIDTLTERLYNMCLPLKFFDKGRLEITDVLKDNFVVMYGVWLKENLCSECLAETDATKYELIYVINYDVFKRMRYTSSLHLSLSDADITLKRLHRRRLPVTNHQNETVIFDVSGKNYFISQITPCKPKEPCINYGKVSDDPYLANYIQELQREFTFDNMFTGMRDKIQYLAEYVDRQLSKLRKSTEETPKHAFEIHLTTLKRKLGTNFIPIGYLRLGYYCERAVLFKALADNLDIPATLCRGEDNTFWNEVALVQTSPVEEECDHQPNQFVYFVIDLMHNIGNLLPIGDHAASAYCNLQTVTNTSKQDLTEDTE